MLSDLVKKLKVSGAVVATTAAFVFASPAQAALIQGDWDPAFGSPFTNLGWRGTVKFFVPNECLLESGVISNNSPKGCANGSMNLLSGQVEFYDTRDAGEPTLRTLVFDGNSVNEDFIKVRVEGGAVVGLWADFNDWVQALPAGVQLPLVNYDLDKYQFNLEFDGDCAVLSYKSQGQSGGGKSDRCKDSSGPFLRFTNLDAMTVPEPGSLALLLTAAGMLAASRRRRPAAAA